VADRTTTPGMVTTRYGRRAFNLNEAFAALPGWTKDVADAEVLAELALHFGTGVAFRLEQDLEYFGDSRGASLFVRELADIFQRVHESPDPDYWLEGSHDFTLEIDRMLASVFLGLESRPRFFRDDYWASTGGTMSAVDLLSLGGYTFAPGA
jgi:hypothetical protein